MPFFGQDIFEQAQALGPLTDAAYLDARETTRRLAGPEGLDAALAEQQLDALVAPAPSPAWLIDPLNGDHFTGAGYGVAAAAGTPSITVPMGDSHGDRKSTRLNSSHQCASRLPSSACQKK